MTDTLLVGFDLAQNGDKPVLIVGRKSERGIIEVVNAMQGEEAQVLYDRLTGKGEDKANERI